MPRRGALRLEVKDPGTGTVEEFSIESNQVADA